MYQIDLPEGKKVYFASDFHLGSPSFEESRKREDLIVEWLEEVRKDAAHIFLIGDIFDFWFEFKTVIPKGFIRFQGKLAEITDSGIPVTIFTGNHDMWLFDYFPTELGVQLLREPTDFKIGNHQFHIGHGDGLGPGDYTYKILKKIFANKICQWLFGFLHPNIGIGIATAWSQSSRKKNHFKDEGFVAKEREWIWTYCTEEEAKKHHDFYVFGHRHLPLDLEVNESAKYLNTGAWFSDNSFGVYDGTDLHLEFYKKELIK
ncbi:UDP-2,3-diacylglucosamine diphosphatase [Sediminitomix flava]|uniref:UDP-2,3-diacylglucosamine hydrolase n=1 Tax=Sediminitomix flava TaxID=379075 RepID=A0A315ZHJ4_SEDFL|nr:UDP-2,3-diacylglucosamine diphosphatase [Sediminitomix flava]PWJ44991.1 UDP-2,3-diacylglucosamine hydrolase [Sediminitomix flava]